MTAEEWALVASVVFSGLWSGMVVAPVLALIAIDDSANAPFVLTAIGLALTIAGPLLVSNRLSALVQLP